jgi:4-alpha-glucanotransferase
MKFKRSSGILLHPTSLPSPDGIGDFGPDAYHWINQLADMGCGLWQILPLGPTGYGDSPYQCFSAFAGNPYLISPLLLAEYDLLTTHDLTQRPDFPHNSVDYGKVIPWKTKLLNRAYQNFRKNHDTTIANDIDKFYRQEEYWLKDYALFMAIKEDQGGISWAEWPQDLKCRDAATLLEFRQANKKKIGKYIFRQFLFYQQWRALRTYANQNGIEIIGDVPIFIAFDSADAWANPELFYFDENLEPEYVAGVPPDYFSPTGQLWGNPLYNWDYHKKSGFEWWISRLQSAFSQVDIVRLDHFRGFVDYWEIPANMPTAEVGNWRPGPGKMFFKTLMRRLGDLPIIAEDLGQINPEVFTLRDELSIPGMKIFQFGFGTDSNDPFLTHNYPINCAAYTGTHDNDTCIGWYENASEMEKDYCRRYTASSGNKINWDMIRTLWASVAQISITTLQDLLGKGSEARMNFPGRASGNWIWRFSVNELEAETIQAIKALNRTFGRFTSI